MPSIADAAEKRAERIKAVRPKLYEKDISLEERFVSARELRDLIGDKEYRGDMSLELYEWLVNNVPKMEAKLRRDANLKP